LAAYAALKIPDYAGAPGSAIPQLTLPVSRGLEAPASVDIKIDQATDDTWKTIAERDPSPSLAVLGETYDYGRQVALTFDDGPDPNVTLDILDVLREHDLKATFFVLGHKVARNPEVLRRIVQEGHTLGNHTYDHANLAHLSVRQMHDEMQSTQEAVDRALGYHYPMTLMRPPYGAPYLSDRHVLPLFQRVMEEQRAYPVMWTVDSRDWELNGQAGSIAENVRTTTSKKGGVVLLHDTHESTADALPLIIAQFAAARFSFTTVREMLADKYGVEPDSIQATPSG
jgi:peptidoglycan/xylan/chitin deacetylase (PgdA/CDA1 family)